MVLSRSQTGESITVNWSIPSLSLARGFLTYTINYQQTTPTGRSRRQSTVECSSSPCSVPVSQGGVVITGLDPSVSYDVGVTPVNEAGTQGPPLTDTSTAVPSGSNIGLIAGAAAGGAIVVLVILILVICCW